MNYCRTGVLNLQPTDQMQLADFGIRPVGLPMGQKFWQQESSVTLPAAKIPSSMQQIRARSQSSSCMARSELV